MNEGSGNKVYDLSENGNVGTLNGPVWGADEQGLNVAFNAGNDHINCGSSVGDLTDNFTILVWFKFNDRVDSNRLISRRSTSLVQYDLYAHKDDGYIQLYTGGTYTGPTYDLNDGNRHMAIMLINGASSYLGYDNNIYGGAFDPTITSRAVDTMFGGWGDAGAYDNLNGMISEVCIYNRVLTPSEVASLSLNPYAMFEPELPVELLDVEASTAWYVPESIIKSVHGAQKPLLGVRLNLSHPLANGLVGCYLLNEGSGNTVYDLSQNGNLGIFVNTPSWIAGPQVRFGGSVPKDYINIPHSPNFSPGSGNFSVVSILTKQHATAGWSDIWGITKWNEGPEGDNNAWALNLTSGGADDHAGMAIRLSGAEKTVETGENLVIGQEYFLVGVRDDDNLHIYQDGILKDTTAGCTGAITDSASYDVRIANSLMDAYQAQIDVRLFYYYNRALIASEIQDLYTNPYGMFEPESIFLLAQSAHLSDGEDLSLTFTDDIAGQTRDTWYIGASEIVPGGAVGDTCWGHVTAVTETNVRTFTGNWTGTGTIGNSGDTERLVLNSGEYMISEVVETGTETVILKQNFYDPTGDDVDMDYRHGADAAACEIAGWNNYTVPFVSLGYVQVRMTSTL